MQKKEFKVKDLMDKTPYACALVDWTNEITHYVLEPSTLKTLLENMYQEGYETALKDFQSMDEVK